MKKIGASLFFAVLVSAAVAQTNAPVTRALSLQDCLAEALKHNFDVRVERYEPEKSLFNLHAAYAGYDPTLSLSGSHNHSDLGGPIAPGQITYFTNFNNVVLTNISGNGISVNDNDSFNTSLGGSLPSGATYSLGGNVTKNYDTGGADYSSGSVGALNLSQPLLKNFWIDETRLNISAAKNQLKYSEQGLRQQLITTVAAVENAFYELIYAQKM